MAMPMAMAMPIAIVVFRFFGYRYRCKTRMGRTKNIRHKSGRAQVPSVVRYHHTSSRTYSHEHPSEGVEASVAVGTESITTLAISGSRVSSSFVCGSSSPFWYRNPSSKSDSGPLLFVAAPYVIVR
eukprot:CAMPEP_0172378146 /NCGR_PEP_ID=MMETSP1060-20121228/69272_1 /TAXON_ID=37318 /ORGANISM="Pseudo-nitzschia pungens, Strain cf. cingulata" /LENGTH=125 /DNA_ID=CAMNT_0013105861 /DNA_START=789 /DNA_END=1166 /DNA_ORIENTATION=+